jgi:hypothetical protein
MVAAESSSLNLAIPQGPSAYQSDKFRAGDLDCSNAIGSATQMEFGVTGIISEDDNPYALGGGHDQSQNVGIYGRIIIPLGRKAKSRIDCNRLYELELKKKQLEVMKLEQELQQLRSLQFEN